MTQGIERFFDDEGRLKLWPSKQAPREEVFCYLAQKFDPGREYSEREVNAILERWHTFQDLFILRRGLVESGWPLRLPNGSRYWRNPEKKGDVE
ncbi:MAG TPA: transcriptional regulator [Clostridiales bacterium]|nr:transcriptional regulator [Clostridiales bacterium]